MTNVFQAVISGIAAFAATNIDDLFLLMLYFSRANNEPHRERSIVLGQYLGFSLLVFISVVGYLGSLLIPRHYLGWLGLFPILLGIWELLSVGKAEKQGGEQAGHDVQSPASPKFSWFKLPKWVNRQTASIAVITVANGSDNLAVYIPLFATGQITAMLIIIAVLLVMVRIWCFIADWLAENPVTARPLRRYGRLLMPFVLMGLGLMILVENGALEIIK